MDQASDEARRRQRTLLRVLFVAGAASVAIGFYIFASARSGDDGIGGVLPTVIGVGLLLLDGLFYVMYTRQHRL